MTENGKVLLVSRMTTYIVQVEVKTVHVRTVHETKRHEFQEDLPTMNGTDKDYILLDPLRISTLHIL